MTDSPHLTFPEVVLNKRQEGIALVIVIVFTVIVMALILSTTSIITVDARRGTSGERSAYQAFLAAETGVNTFTARVREGGFGGNLADLACWVQGRSLGGASCASGTANLTTLALGDAATSPRVDVEVVAVNAPQSTVTVRAVGTVGTGLTAARATVLQDMYLKRPPNFNVASPAALVSCPPIDMGGNSEARGESASRNGSGDPNTGVITDMTTIASGSPTTTLTASTVYPVTIRVADPTAIDSGSYLRIGNYTYLVEGRNGTNDVSVRPVPAPSTSAYPISLSSGTSVGVIPFAVRATPVQQPNVVVGSSTFSVVRLPVNDPTGFAPNDIIYVNVGGTNRGAVVHARGFAVTTPSIDYATGYVDLRVVTSMPSPGDQDYTYTLNSQGKIQNLQNSSISPLSLTDALALTQGSPVRRFVNSATSRQSISNGGSSSPAPPYAANNPNIGAATGCGNALFQQVFNITKAQMQDRLTPTTSVPTLFTRGAYWLNPPAGSSSVSLPSTFCGEGIMIINGDLNISGNGVPNSSGSGCDSGSGNSPAGFKGLIYVAGNLKVQSNTKLLGSIVVEGNISVPDTTDLRGTLNVSYDQKSLLRSGQALSELLMRAEAGTWRQQ